jgi:hypothetical protein
MKTYSVIADLHNHHISGVFDSMFDVEAEDIHRANVKEVLSIMIKVEQISIENWE